MAFIKVWCEYGIAGHFGHENNETVLEVADDEEDVDRLLIDKYSWLWQGLVKDEREDCTDLIDAELMDWEYIEIEKLEGK